MPPLRFLRSEPEGTAAGLYTGRPLWRDSVCRSWTQGRSYYRMAMPIMQKGKTNSMRSARTMAEFDYPTGDLLVSAAWLAQHLYDPHVKIIDARSSQDYAAGHIPGAVLLPNGAFRSTRGVLDGRALGGC